MKKSAKTDETEFQKLGRRIKLLRVSKSMSQGELAKRLGITQTGLSSMEHGKSSTTLRRLYQMRDILGCTMRDFFEEEERLEEGDVSVKEVIEAMRVMRQLKLAETSKK